MEIHVTGPGAFLGVEVDSVHLPKATYAAKAPVGEGAWGGHSI